MPTTASAPLKDATDATRDLRPLDSFREPGSDDRALTVDPAATAQEALRARGQGAVDTPASGGTATVGAERRDIAATPGEAPAQPPEPQRAARTEVRQYRARPLSRSGRRGLATARGLGWFSIALGLAEVLMPRLIARTLGVPSESLVRLYGIREIVTGVGLLTARDPAPWVAARVAGDAVDLATLMPQAVAGHPQRGPAIAALATVAAVTAVDAGTVTALRGEQRRQARPVYDYSDRSGFPRPTHEMRGAALKDFTMPRDMRGPMPRLVRDGEAG
jgi:hypothetical protein